MDKAALATYIKGLSPSLSTVDYMYQQFFQQVIDTNIMLGMMDRNKDEMIDSYEVMLRNEIDEVFESVEDDDPQNLAKELVDVLVVGGFLYYLEKGYNFIQLFGDGVAFDAVSVNTLVDAYDVGETTAFVLQCTMSLLGRLPVDIQGLLNEVIESNLSKFTKYSHFFETGLDYHMELEEVIAADLKTIEEAGRYSDLSYTLVEDPLGIKRVVFWCGKEYDEPKVKYLKGPHYKEADVSKYWLA